MYIAETSYDDWKDGKDFGDDINMPSWNDIEQMISNLNGDDKTEVIFGNSEEKFYMYIGGGANQRYIVYISYNEERKFYNLRDIEKKEDKEEFLVVGGQEGRFDANECVSKDLAMKAAKYFFENLKPHPDPKWED